MLEEVGLRIYSQDGYAPANGKAQEMNVLLALDDNKNQLYGEKVGLSPLFAWGGLPYPDAPKTMLGGAAIPQTFLLDNEDETYDPHHKLVKEFLARLRSSKHKTVRDLEGPFVARVKEGFFGKWLFSYFA